MVIIVIIGMVPTINARPVHGDTFSSGLELLFITNTYELRRKKKEITFNRNNDISKVNIVHGQRIQLISILAFEIVKYQPFPHLTNCCT